LTLVFNRVDHGPGSTFLFGLKPGDQIQFKGPAEAFACATMRHAISCLSRPARGLPRSVHAPYFVTQSHSAGRDLALGFRTQRDLYYQEDLHELATRHPMFHRTITLSRPEPGWTGPTGRVTALVQEHVKTVDNLAVYLCGNGGMIKDVTDFLRSKGLCPIYREKWYDEEDEEP